MIKVRIKYDDLSKSFKNEDYSPTYSALARVLRTRPEFIDLKDQKVKVWSEEEELEGEYEIPEKDWEIVQELEKDWNLREFQDLEDLTFVTFSIKKK